MKVYATGALMLIVGMLFMNSLIGEYSRYGMAIADEIDDCEIKEQKECGYAIAPITLSSVSPSAFHVAFETSLKQSQLFWQDPNLSTRVVVSVPSFSFSLA